MEICRIIHERIRHESPNASIVADVHAHVAMTVGANGPPQTDKDPEGLMENAEDERASDAPPELRDGEDGQGTPGRGAPIDEDVAGELNAALPEDEPGEDDATGGPNAA